MLLGIGLTTVLGVVYLMVADASFTASSMLMIDVRAGLPFQQQTNFIDTLYANGIAESEVEVHQSIGVARAVVRQLGLANDPVFLGNGRSITAVALGLITAPFATQVQGAADDGEIAAAELLNKMTRVRRVGMSFILELDVTTHDPMLLARLNDAMVDAFVDAGLDAMKANTKRASVWLEDRLATLQHQAAAADRAVQDFKAEAGSSIPTKA